MTFETGTRVGRYEIQSLIGVGGMGEVYRALDTELDRPAALKFLPTEVAADPRRMSRFVQEAKAASALNHPNILTVYDIGQTEEGLRFFAAEFIDGTTLRDHMKARRMKLGDVLDVCAQVASALASAHAAGIVHRDIKPENIMLRKDGYVKVLDFGLAKVAGRTAVDSEAATQALVNTNPGSVMGTVAYMSPEQARGLEVDHRTDIWSLGVVLYEMLGVRAWSPDGQAVDYAVVREGVANLWRLPLAGNNSKPRQLTDWNGDFIYAFAWSPDGKSLAASRGAPTRDIVLIKDFR